MRALLSKVCFVFGLAYLVFFFYLLWQRNTPKPLVTIPYKKESYTTGLPMRITIPYLHSNLSVYPSKIVNQTWQITDQGVSYLTSTPLPGSLGNSILYAHDWPSLFGNLDQLKTGQPIFITFSNGTTKKFLVYYTAIVPSTQISILHQTHDKRITLYTCTGFLDTKRFVVVAMLH